MSAPQNQHQALILFAHGARDPRWAEPLARLQQLIAASVSSSVHIHQAFLELMSPTLPELVAQLAAQHCQAITVVPIFLGQGGHVRRDLPQLMTQLEAQYPQIQFNLATAIGENERVLMAIAEVCVANLFKSL
ncbi:sirohydrochlorin chelatase [Solimicrobium silvestre]|uniref:CbiX n=1 Tax=Solimicrobium silvestre TaxID=2099400 RepID=A0A2S9H5N5_9BURK|nr:CbiX/SirB N-terminal domain-containing protein [Solimicrobium silvestre]PRC95251.1 CbiX [Solimicrobium silvestre]